MTLNGVLSYDLSVNEDIRGALIAFDQEKNRPFPVRRSFLIKMPEPGIARAEHACSAEQLIVVVQGRVTFDLDDGRRSESVTIAAGATALWVKPGRWLRMIAQEAGTILFVLASQPYSETRYFDRAQTDACDG